MNRSERRKARRTSASNKRTDKRLQACISTARETSWYDDGSIAEFSVGPEWTNLSDEEAETLLAETEPSGNSANGWPWWACGGQVRMSGFDEDNCRTYIAIAWEEID